MDPIRSLAQRTELFFHRHAGIVEDRGDHLMVRTPNNPGYYWGNFLLYAAPPAPGDLARWSETFRATFADEPRVRHVSFGWDSPDGAKGASAEFLAAGFEADDAVVLTTGTVRPPPKVCADVVIRPIRSDADWDAVLDLQVRCRADRFEEVAYRDFKRAKFVEYRRLAELGLGDWWGAFRELELAADLGLFFDGPVGRFQAVETSPEHRRLGVCGTLVHHVAAAALAAGRAKRLVMLADESYHAACIYESVGFRPDERLVGLLKSPS